MKKVLILIITTVIFIGVLSFGAYKWISNSKQNNSDALQAIPIDAPILIRIESLPNLAKSLIENDLWQNASVIKEASNINKMLLYSDSLYHYNSLVKNLFTNNPAYLSIHPIGKNSTGFILSVKLPDLISTNEILEYVKLQTVGLYQLNTTEYDKSTIYNFKLNNLGIETLNLTVKNNVFLVSNSELLLQNAINQLNQKISLTNNPQFKAIQKTAGNGMDANLFICFPHSAGITSRLAGNSVSPLSFTDIGEWSEIDYKLNTNGKFFGGGVITTSDSSNSYLNLLSHQSPESLKLPLILQKNTAFFADLYLSDIPRFFEDYRNYLDKKGDVFRYTQTLSKLAKSIGIEPEEVFKQITDGEIALAYVPWSKNEKECWFSVIKTNSPSKTELLLKDLLSKSGKENSPKTVKINANFKVNVYPFISDNFTSSLVGSLFDPVNESCFTIIDKYLVIGSSAKGLGWFADNFSRNITLENSANFDYLSSQLTRESNLLIYAAPEFSSSPLKSYLSINFANFIQTLVEKGTKTFALQIIGGNSPIYLNSIALEGKAEKVSESKPEWICNLDSKPTIKPQILTNHITGENEILVQDELNVIYLLNSKGQILWKRPVNGQIMGSVDQVDIYKNRKLQMVFNTATSLYIIDRNGNNLDGFPVKYQFAATNPVLIVDYDNRRDYRFFQACTNRKIYCYDKNGKIVKGWKFDKTETVVTGRLGYANVSGKDYIVAFDANRSYFLNRRGEERLKPNQLFSKGKNSTFSLSNIYGQGNFIITTDTNGIVKRTFFDGRIDEIIINKFSANHAFDYADINGDRLNEYIFVDNSELTVYNQKKEKLFSKRFSFNPKNDILLFDFGKQQGIGLYSQNNEKIALINSDGDYYNGFPMTGYTPFSITKLKGFGHLNLIVGLSDGSIICYSLNNK